MEEKISFGKFIIKKRKEKNMTQRELAEELYVTESAVSKWERGVSYPDITLVTNICEILGISERELITASDDYKQREMEQQARRFRKLIQVWLWIFNVSYVVSLVACFICNLAIDHTLSWFFIVLTAEMTAFSLTSLPFLLKKNRWGITLISFFISLTLLMWVCSLYTGGSWFLVAFVSVLLGMVILFFPFAVRDIRLPGALSSHKALLCFAVDTVLLVVLITVCSIYTGTVETLFSMWLPVTGVGLIVPWLFMLVIRYIKVNSYFKAAICFVISGIFIALCNPVLSVIIDGNPFQPMLFNYTNWSEDFINGNINLLIAAICIIAAVNFIGKGIEASSKKNK